jgi:hypothetical protein
LASCQSASLAALCLFVGLFRLSSLIGFLPVSSLAALCLFVGLLRLL